MASSTSAVRAGPAEKGTFSSRASILASPARDPFGSATTRVYFEGFQPGPRTGCQSRTEGTAAGAGPVRAGAVGVGTAGELLSPPPAPPPLASSFEQALRVRTVTAPVTRAVAEPTSF